ncbi:MAG: monovalent cation/H(+) antiporter subunit G [Thermoprotei archaeon]
MGAISDLIASIGMHRFKNFYLRLHAATIGTIWGAFVPMIGASLVAIGYEPLGIYRWFVAGAALVTAVLTLILAPAGSHALARATHRAKLVKVEPCLADHLDESMCVKGDIE